LYGCLFPADGLRQRHGKNLSGGGRNVVSRVKTDIAVIRGDSEYDYNYLQGTLWTLDTPLSFIGDTLMLPVDYFHGPWSIHSGK
jgi:uncharacterized protein YceK